jgi:NAD(P)-dependent dehydrogenase (short-subunit alcohol dehydrogenase family)
VLNSRRGEALESLAADCRGVGAEVHVRAADVSDEGEVRALAAAAVERFGRIDVWVNNAAVIAYGRLEETPGEVWRRVVETNVFGAFHGAAAVLPWFREQGQGVLINVSSILGKTGAPYQSAYVASKHAMRAMGECVAQETVDVPGIKVCTVLPGPVDTPFFEMGANFTGRKVVPPGSPVDARRVAAAIVRCARRPRREVIVGAGTRFGLISNRIAPGTTERAAARLMEHTHFEDDPVSRTEGNVFEPVSKQAQIDGGWREDRSPFKPLLILAAAVAGSPSSGGLEHEPAPTAPTAR